MLTKEEKHSMQKRSQDEESHKHNCIRLKEWLCSDNNRQFSNLIFKAKFYNETLVSLKENNEK